MPPFPLSDANPPEHTGPLPAETDVVVIGGGVIGVTTALFLARAGVPVLLLEKGRVAAEQSSRNWGWIRVQGRDLAEIPIAQEAQELWQGLAPELDTDIGLTQGGIAYLAKDAGEMAKHEAWRAAAAPFGVSTQLLDAQATARLIPQAARGWAGALWTPTDLRAEPFVAVPALARLAAKSGAMIREGQAVRGLDIAAGRVVGVIAEGGRVRARAVVLAGGAWSSLLLRRHGVSLPQLSVRATVVRTTPGEEVFAGGAVDPLLAFRRRADGGYSLAPEGRHDFYIGPDAFRALPKYLAGLVQDPFGTALRPAAPKHFPDAWTTPRRWADDAVSPFERMRVLNPAPNRTFARRILRNFNATFPGLGGVGEAQSWAGMIDVLPDAVPVVDAVAALPGLTLATGMSGHGFGIGPAFGRIVADLVQGRPAGHDLTRFPLGRFSDGTGLAIGPGL